MENTEIDALVAEKVMGWAVVRDIRFWDHSNNNGRPCFVQYAEGRWGVVRHGGSTYEPWSPSTQIGDAWQVVEKMGDDGFKVLLERCTPAKHWHAHVYAIRNNRQRGMVYADTAPLAICKASLAALAALEAAK